MRWKTMPYMPFLLTIAAGLLALGCASRKPVATMAQADLAMDHALKTKAPTLASAELRSAQAKLTQAREAMAEGENDEARRLAEDALAQAQLAEAKADSRFAETEVREQVEALRGEARRLGVTTTATETTIIQQREPRVVVVP